MYKLAVNACFFIYFYVNNLICQFSFRFLGTSGQNIDDLEKYSEAKDKLEFMERTLRWRHLAPTAPNTLGKSYCCLSPCLICFFFVIHLVRRKTFDKDINKMGRKRDWLT